MHMKDMTEMTGVGEVILTITKQLLDVYIYTQRYACASIDTCRR